MARLARVKLSGAYYHLYCKVSAKKGFYPLSGALARQAEVDIIKLYSRVYCLKVLGFCVMGNHYHLVVRMDSERKMTRAELEARAKVIYSDEVLDEWLAHKWTRFEQRIFDVSEFMKNVPAKIARWHNKVFDHEGRVWGERFKSTLLEDERAAMDCLLYIDLNPVRAGMVKRPEEYESSSIYLRENKQDDWLMPLQELTGFETRAAALKDYRARLYYRGAVASKAGQAVIPRRIVEDEEARGFSQRGAFSKRLTQFVSGIAIGSDDFVTEIIQRAKERSVYVHPKQLNR